MAGRLRLLNYIPKCFNTFSNQSSLVKHRQKLCFHTSVFLNVKGQPINMPSLSPTMTEGTIVKWLKKEGDTVAPGDVLCEIQTDKAVMSFETEEEGILAKILLPENSKDIKVGTLIALMVNEGEDWQSVESESEGPSSTAAGSSAAPSPEASSGGVSGQSINMPSLSPTMTEGTIVKWVKKEGDPVAPGDVLCEIQTDKAVMSFETEEEGILAKILVPENTKDVKVGTLIAIMVAEGEDWQNVSVSDGASAPAAAPVAAQGTPPSGGSVPGLEVNMPSLSPTMTEGLIVNWLKKEGDTIAPGDVLCEIQTDKAVMSFETEEEGILAKILQPANQNVQVGALIALIVPEGADWKDVMIPGIPAPAPVAAASSPAAPTTFTAPATSSPPAAPEPVKHEPHEYGPAAHRLLNLYQIDAKQVPTTGRGGKLLKSDVLKYVEDNKLQPKPPKPVPLPVARAKAEPKEAAKPSPAFASKPRSGYTDIEVSSMRRTIAKRLTESKTQIPHAYSIIDSEVDQILSIRKELKASGISVSVNDFVIKAVALALKQYPVANCLYVKDEIVSAPGIDISVAVATENGLITPIVKSADTKSITEISAEVRELAGKARKGKLQLHEFQGGSFTISNLGMFGISEFSAIINPPQCGILAVGGGRSLINLDGKPFTKMASQLSYDARAISEPDAAMFLEIVQLYLENPRLLLGDSEELRFSSQV
uniref:Dihydrolipoamide acetyltransferase component of pyruvate dehydrogenase complex n=1 Tax=Bemisia tabaci TaxID=7038 RepID=A0A7S5HFZ2_BEMTA|nr:pyruvate dehydrogenase protein X component [Bemisia tabaci]